MGRAGRIGAKASANMPRSGLGDKEVVEVDSANRGSCRNGHRKLVAVLGTRGQGASIKPA